MEKTYKNQDRWNNSGRAHLEKIQSTPDKFFIDPDKLSRQKLDLIKAMSAIEGKKILEFGSGRGEFSVALAKLGGSVTGIDIGENLVELANKVAIINNVECKFFVCSVDKLHFEDNSFDFVVGSAILHHLSKKAVKDALNEAYRVLKPEGMALFIEPVENSRVFDFVQNLVPAGKPGTSRYRPSILQRKKWTAFLENVDDRALSNVELINAKGKFEKVEFRYYGLLIRLIRIFPNPKFIEILSSIDSLLTHEYSPFKKLAQNVLVLYRK
ncbi:MAG: class I SAM-dependent methyltransferase [Anaerolineales bacterium]|nr:class I SAM-dependent methyltransferase [Anaerolineales bacterium]